MASYPTYWYSTIWYHTNEYHGRVQHRPAHACTKSKDLIERTSDGWAFLDPGFALWFEREYLGDRCVLWHCDQSFTR